MGGIFTSAWDTSSGKPFAWVLPSAVVFAEVRRCRYQGDRIVLECNAHKQGTIIVDPSSSFFVSPGFRVGFVFLNPRRFMQRDTVIAGISKSSVLS
jgi:hypothetical protein